MNFQTSGLCKDSLHKSAIYILNPKSRILLVMELTHSCWIYSHRFVLSFYITFIFSGVITKQMPEKRRTKQNKNIFTQCNISYTAPYNLTGQYHINRCQNITLVSLLCLSSRWAWAIHLSAQNWETLYKYFWLTVRLFHISNVHFYFYLKFQSQKSHLGLMFFPVPMNTL